VADLVSLAATYVGTVERADYGCSLRSLLFDSLIVQLQALGVLTG